MLNCCVSQRPTVVSWKGLINSRCSRTTFAWMLQSISGSPHPFCPPQILALSQTTKIPRESFMLFLRPPASQVYKVSTWSRWALTWNILTGRVLPAAQKPSKSVWEGSKRGCGWGRWGPSCLIETNCSPLPSDTDSRPFVPAGLCWEQQKGNVLILAKDKVRGFLLHASYLSLCAHPLEQAQRLSSSGACYILLD